MAFRLVKHALLMIFRNFGAALKVSILPCVLAFGFMVAFFFLFAGIVSPNSSGPGLLLVLVPIFVMVGLFVMGWVAVAWHRYVLLEEAAKFLPAISDRPVWPYAGRVLLYGLAIAAFAIPAGWVINAIAVTTSYAVSQLASFVLSIFLTVIWMRWATTLPAVAVGAHTYMFEGWEKTAPFTGTIFGVALILLGLNFFVTFLVAALLFPLLYSSVAAAGLLQFALFAVQWLTFMMGLSILTTLYGHIYEGRPLTD